MHWTCWLYVTTPGTTDRFQNVTTTRDIGAPVDGQTHLFSQNLPSSNSQNPLPQQSHSAAIPRHIVKSNQTDDEQSGVKKGNRACENKNNWTDDEQFEVKNGHKAGENQTTQTDDEQSEIRNGQEAGENQTTQTDDEHPGI